MTDEKKYEDEPNRVLPPRGLTEQTDYTAARAIERDRAQRVVVAMVTALIARGWTMEALRLGLDAMAAKSWRVNEEKLPEDVLGEYIADHLESWSVVGTRMYEGVNREEDHRYEIKLRCEDEDTICIDASRHSTLGKILIAISRRRYP